MAAGSLKWQSALQFSSALTKMEVGTLIWVRAQDGSECRAVPLPFLIQQVKREGETVKREPPPGESDDRAGARRHVWAVFGSAVPCWEPHAKVGSAVMLGSLTPQDEARRRFTECDPFVETSARR